MMLKLLLLTMVLVAVVHTDTNTCVMRKGKKLRTFSNTKERVKIPCKYNAIKNTVCGDWKVMITPGNAIEANKKKRYIVKTMWIGVQKVSTGEKWEGRTDLKIAGKYLEGIKDTPVNKKFGELDTSDVFNFTSSRRNNVIMTETNGQFQITYGLYEPGDAWHRSSGFQFDCYSSNFVPTAFPLQLCGDGTKDEIAAYKRSKGWTDERQATIFYTVFTSTRLVQMDPNCKATATAMRYNCTSEEQRYNASKLCWPIVGKGRFHTCVSNNIERPESAMKHCVEYVCSNFTDLNACLRLCDEIDYCQRLDVISEKVKAHCAPTLVIRD